MRLDKPQLAAVSPADNVWLSASAGTGKTQVLSARVLRLLLDGVDPSQILCLTFTRAGATEMAARINATLARWVRAGEVQLADELIAIGADHAPAALTFARTLFAAVLDCPGGGLRIDTIHAFSQWLLAAFPEEAGLFAGARPMEERQRGLLARDVLAGLLLDDARGGGALGEALAALSLRMGEAAAQDWLFTCAAAEEVWHGPGAWQPPLDDAVRRLLGLPADADAGWVAAACADAVFDTPALRRCLAVNRAWPTKTGQDAAEVIAWWLGQDEDARLARIDDLWGVFFTQSGTLRASKALDKIDPDYPAHAEAVSVAIARVRERRDLLALAARLVPALGLGRAFALAWSEAKAREGLLDFDDQIRRAAALLHRSAMAEWIRYKLDRRFDHILVDEAQDTNAAQWRIIKALTGDFFAGEGARGDRVRTLFVVGDYKQAIFGFQGTSPRNFAEAQEFFGAQIDAAAANAEVLGTRPASRRLARLGLERSFRAAGPVLDFVDRAITALGHAAFGLDTAPGTHKGEVRPGYVAVWRPVGSAEGTGDAGDAGDAGQEWLAEGERELAERLARQIAAWLDPAGPGLPLVKGAPRRAGAGDIMVLVRKRGALASLIVARLHALNVPVAGVDRLRLGAPLAVRDLVAALRFAAQPLDDLNLAALLVSPLIGWSQDELLEAGYRPKGVALWDHLRRQSGPALAAAMDPLLALLARADFEPVQALLHWLLVGPWDGRRRLVARLGREANDPIDELLNAAAAFAASATPSLVGFLAWFDAGEGELKREASAAGNLCRVMTVHGAKGLQAPVVILADATGNPDNARARDLEVTDPASASDPVPRRLPLPALRREERLGRLAEAEAAAARAEREEHWRLLYVAMTRAEEALFITGALTPRDRGVPAADSWYARLAGILPETGEDWLADPVWGARREHGALAPPVVAASSAPLPVASPALPGWLTQPLAPEPRPPRPLAPSALGEDAGAEAPLSGADSARLAAAARRGTLIHRLLERLPMVVPAERAAAAARWLARQAGDCPAAWREDIATAVLMVIADPRWAELFAPEALAEVPIVALVGTRIVAGTIDRLVITPDRIRLVDFKTARRPPATPGEVPEAVLRQMAAYVAALEVTYPGRAVEAALLYTQTPLLLALPAAVIERHKRGLSEAEESLGL
ncbi:MAG: double-strand break repair helicase AddA [Sphingomonadales bacterium]|nr:double-strand break repair helicase AddA [Sphingomonadales bacterium]